MGRDLQRAAAPLLLVYCCCVLHEQHADVRWGRPPGEHHRRFFLIVYSLVDKIGIDLHPGFDPMIRFPESARGRAIEIQKNLCALLEFVEVCVLKLWF